MFVFVFDVFFMTGCILRFGFQKILEGLRLRRNPFLLVEMHFVDVLLLIHHASNEEPVCPEDSLLSPVLLRLACRKVLSFDCFHYF